MNGSNRSKAVRLHLAQIYGSVRSSLSYYILTKLRTELEQMMTDSPVEITNMMEMVITTTEQCKSITEALEIAEARLISVVDAELVKLTGKSALA